MTASRSFVDDCFILPEEQLTSLFERAFSISRESFPEKIAFYAPGMVHYKTEFHEATDPYRFPSVSITGRGCALNCEHCHGQLLETMIPATTPEALWEVCNEVKERGGTGCLISGGATPLGNTPMQPFIPIIKRIKDELGLDIVIHTGIVYPEVAEALGDAGIDGAMMDVIGSEATLREIYHLDVSVDVFDKSMTLLEDNGVPHMPHIIAGLHFGTLKGEAEAVRMIADHNPTSVVVVAFMPLDCTPMEKVQPASPIDIARVIAAARIAIPDKPLILGCARPLGMHRRTTDRLAIDAGVNGIAYPSDEGYQYALERGMSAAFANECCSLISRVL
ncbi:MAG: radical SAM protein [Candidatus Thorarchaeota archaeon]